MTKIKTKLPTAQNTSPHEDKVPEPLHPLFVELVKNSVSTTTVKNVDALNKLYRAWEIGCDVYEAGIMSGLTPRVIEEWLKECPELKELRDTLRSSPRVLAKKNVYSRLHSDPTGEYSLKYLERVKPDEFGGKGAVININNTNVSVSEKSSSLTDFMSQFGGDIIDG